jgi:hypothetical protein
VIYYAQNIQTGNASAKSSVVNEVEGSGNVTTHIETTANGQTNIIDANGNGGITVSNDNGKVSVTKTPQVTIVQTQTLNSTPTPTMTPVKTVHKTSFFSNFIEKVSNFINRIFKDL